MPFLQFLLLTNLTALIVGMQLGAGWILAFGRESLPPGAEVAIGFLMLLGAPLLITFTLLVSRSLKQPGGASGGLACFIGVIIATLIIQPGALLADFRGLQVASLLWLVSITLELVLRRRGIRPPSRSSK
jgi:hypothetical protein